MPMWLLSGAFFPAGALGPSLDWAAWALAWVMLLNPLTYGVAGLRQLMYWGVANPPLPADTPR